MKSEQPLVSVVLPTYNRAHFIGQAVTSALNQTYQNIELIVVDDGSTDETSRVIATFDDERLSYIRLPENVGRSAARNKALGLVRGDFVAFLDSDDYFLPGKTELQVDFLKNNPDVDMVYTASGCFLTEDAPINYFYRAPVSGHLHSELAFFKPLTITLPTVMLRREVLNKVPGFDEKMERFEDTDFWRRIAKHFKIGAINQVTCHIRSHKGNHISAFDPSSFEQAIEYYVQKVMREDRDVDLLVLQAGSRRLYELYGTALTGVPGAAALSAKLTAKGRSQFEPLVSIIIPVYNGENYLKQAIDSALAQTYRNIEVVVVNDGSTDEGATERVTLEYGNRVRYIAKPNGGCASALNRAVQEARGDYISWLSHDDLLAPAKLERQIAFLAQQGDPGSCIVYGDYSVFYGDGVKHAHVPAVNMPPVRPEDFRYFLTTHNILHGCSLLIPRRAIIQHGMFDESLKTVLDFDLWFKMGKTERYLFLPGVVVHARAHPDQDTNRRRDIHMKEANDLLARFASELSEAEIKSGSKQQLTAGYYVIADTLKRRNFHEAASEVLKLAEKTVLNSVRPGATAAGGEGLETLFAIARRAIERGILAPPAAGLESTAPVQYEGAAPAPPVLATPTAHAQAEAPAAAPAVAGLTAQVQVEGIAAAAAASPTARVQYEAGPTTQVQYEGPAVAVAAVNAIERPARGVKGLVKSILRRLLLNSYFAAAVKVVARIPLTKWLALKLIRGLPRGSQDRLADLWRQHRT